MPPFNRLAQAHGGIDGTGIGLSLMRARSTLMQERIVAQSGIGAGATFCVMLPRA